MRLTIPNVALVAVLGSEPATAAFAGTHFQPGQLVPAGDIDGMVEAARARLTTDGFAVVVVPPADGNRVRAELVHLARRHHVLPVAVGLTEEGGEPQWTSSALAGAGFRVVHLIHGAAEAADARLVLEPLPCDRRSETGPFDAIGDVHGCLTELVELLTTLGYAIETDAAGRPVSARHPAGRRVIFLGDLVDRGPDTPGVLRLAAGMVRQGDALVVRGNHEDKLVRAVRGNAVHVSRGLAESLRQLAAEPADVREVLVEFCAALVDHYVLDGGRLVVAHAGLAQRYHGRSSATVRAFALYGLTTGERDADGFPVRLPWAEDYDGHATVLYGHTPIERPQWVNNTLCLDTGCVYGGRLSALRYPEREVVSVPALRVWHERRAARAAD